MNSSDLLEKIEEVREELNEIGKVQKLVDAEVIRVSQQLDNLIIIYQKLLEQEKHK